MSKAVTSRPLAPVICHRVWILAVVGSKKDAVAFPARSKLYKSVFQG